MSMTYGRQEALTTFKNGVAHGWMIERSSSGSVGWSGNYVDGKRDGVFTYYSDPREEEYRDGVLIKWKNDLRNIDPTTFKKDTSAHNRKQAIQKKPLRCENKGSESTTLIRVESKSNKELITKEFTCKAGLADGDHKTYNWLGTMLSHSDMKDGFLHGKVRIYNDGALDSVGEFVEGEQIGPVYVYSSTREDWGTFDPKLDPSVEMDWDSDVQVGKRVAKSVDETKKLWDMKSRIAFVGLSLDHRAQLVPSIAYGPMPCNYSREWSCDMSALRLSAFLGKRNGIAVDFTVGEYGVISDLLSVGARFDEEFGGGPMVSAEIGIAYFTLLLRGTWFVPKGRGEMDVGINFTYALKEKKRY